MVVRDCGSSEIRLVNKCGISEVSNLEECVIGKIQYRRISNPGIAGNLDVCDSVIRRYMLMFVLRPNHGARHRTAYEGSSV